PEELKAGARVTDHPAPPAPPPHGRVLPPDGGDNVACAVFAPPGVAQGEDVLIQVFAFAVGNEAEATRQAAEYDEAAVRRGQTTLDLAVLRGQVLELHLELRGVRVEPCRDRLTWRGQTASVQFAVTTPADRPAGSLLGSLLVSTGGVPVGRI